MAGIVLEGGTFRPIFSAGVMDALLEHDLMFDYCIGVSAGISNGFSYISKQKGRNLEVLINYRNDKRYLSRRNFIKCRSLFGLEFVYDEIPNKINPFDWNTFSDYKGRVLVGVTNATTGQPEYLDGLKCDLKFTMLRATCAMPIFFPSIEMDQGFYYDGGLADPIPIKKSIKDGNSKNLIILTRPKGYFKEYGRENDVVIRMMKRRFPNLEQVIKNRPAVYNEAISYCEKLKAEGSAVILRPEYTLNSMEKSTDVLKDNYMHGYNMAIENLERIKELLI